jgi:hypothetical protein
MINDQAIFLARLQDYRRTGAQALLEHGVEPDSLLLQEVRTPGADQRYGVNLIARPPLPVVSYIRTLQERLRVQEPCQYFYPADDLHVTLIECCSGQVQGDAETLARAVVSVLPNMLERAPQALLVCPLLGYDQRACALNFLPIDHALQALRDHLVTQLSDHGIAIVPRYPPRSAHVTFLRYLQPLQTDPTAWVDLLQSVPDTALEWQIDALWLTWGATWYGMLGRTRICGPYVLQQTERTET